ncbi:MAG: hypothetical protein WKF81_03265 [Thermomicrobiales bacterium]
MIVSNMALAFGVLSDTVEVLISVIMMIGGIWITHKIQKWADKTSAPQPSAANVGKGGGYQTHERRSIRS